MANKEIAAKIAHLAAERNRGMPKMDNIRAIGILRSLMLVPQYKNLQEYDTVRNRNMALKMAIKAIEEQENAIVLGRDYWSRYYDITEKEWRTEDGEFFDKSFCITKKGEGEPNGTNH